MWIGTRPLTWLELFMIYSWRRWGCRVNLFTHYPESGKVHTFESLGLPDGICDLHDAAAVIAAGETMPKTREVLTAWFAEPMPIFDKPFTYNMADLMKSYIAANIPGIVLDIKISPSPHLPKYVASGVFENKFVGMRRAGTVENCCMGSMSVDNTARSKYGTGFEITLFYKRIPSMLIQDKSGEWFGKATAAHIRGAGKGTWVDLPEGLRGDWIDIGREGKARHQDELQIHDAEFVGIAGEEGYGPFRIFKREEDQTNRAGNIRTTAEDRHEMKQLTLRELREAASAGSLPAEDEGGIPSSSAIEDLLTRAELRSE